jgi:hypothetical protein
MTGRRSKKQAKPSDEPVEPEQESPTPDLGGRPTIYTEALGVAVCEHLADGLSLRSIEKLPGMPSKRTVIRWALEDRDGFGTIYAHGRALQIECEADEIVDIADDGTNDWIERENKKTGDVETVLNREAIERSRLRVETRKWRLTKLAPQKYGDKIVTENTTTTYVIADKPMSQDDWEAKYCLAASGRPATSSN